MEKKFRLNNVSVRLVKERAMLSETPLTTPETAVKVMGDYLKEMDREVLMLLNLDCKLKPISCSVVSVGTINEAMANPREIFKAAVLSNAATMILMHGHPSGDVTPSKADVMMTDRMNKACNLMGIELVDHIIVGSRTDDYFSFKEKKIMSFSQNRYEDDYTKINLDAKVAEEERKR